GAACEWLDKCVLDTLRHSSKGTPMSTAKPRSPKYCLHKPKNQAYVRLDGRMIYLGIYGSSESYAAYTRGLAEWFASGCAPVLPEQKYLSVNEMLLAYRTH